jgi:membrane protein implicated in regulation of membrane protease activity
MGRLVVLILLVVLAVWLIRRALRSSTTQKTQGKPPLPEAHLAGGLLYCGEEHARLGGGER